MFLLTVTARTHSLDDETRMQFLEQAESGSAAGWNNGRG